MLPFAISTSVVMRFVGKHRCAISGISTVRCDPWIACCVVLRCYSGQRDLPMSSFGLIWSVHYPSYGPTDQSWLVILNVMTAPCCGHESSARHRTSELC